MTAFSVIETIRRVALLGVRCLDAGTGAPVTAGLSLRAVPLAGGAWSTARPTASCLLAFHRLPGLHDAGFGKETLGSPPRLPFALLLEDRLGRYQDVGLLLDLPRVRPLVLRLLPLPGATLDPGVLALRGSLRDATRLDTDGHPLPAALALIEARRTTDAAEEPALGLADARGEFVVALPRPDPLAPPADAPTGSPPTLGERRWPVGLRFRFQPSALRWLRPLDRSVEVLDAPAPGAVPEVEALADQAEAELALPLAGGFEVLVPFATSAIVRGTADDGAVLLRSAPAGSP